VSGKYCEHCGQPVQSPVKPLVAFMRETVGEVLSIDGPLIRSLRALVTRPGELTVEYLDGRRTRFVHPVRLFIHTGVGAYLVTRLLPTASALFGVGPELFGEGSSLLEVLGAAALIPMGALSHWLALRKQRPMLMEHGVFVLHIMAFSFLLAPLEGLLFSLSGSWPLLETISASVAPIIWGVYWVFSLARFNNRTPRQAFGDAFRVYVAALLVTLPLFLYQFFRG